MDENACSHAIIRAAIEVHRFLGPGLLERVYEDALSHELELRGLRTARQVALPIRYKGIVIGDSLRLDLIVEDSVVLEIKSVETILALHEHQLHTYLRLSGKRLGLLLNFNCSSMRRGVKRVVNDL